MRIADLRPLPDDPEAWMRSVAAGWAGAAVEDTETVAGWPVRLVCADGRLYAFYRFYTHVGWAAAEGTDAGRAQLLSARPEFGDALFVLRDFWS